MNLEILFDLLKQHSTPGDENEIHTYLASFWGMQDLDVRSLGKYAVTGTHPGTDHSAPSVLICAHMDSPGFIVESRTDDQLNLLPLGSPRFDGNETEVVLKTDGGKFLVQLTKKQISEDAKPTYFCKDIPEATKGDRACFIPIPEIHEDDTITSPFLDNRLGCFILCELAQKLKTINPACTVTLGATACEEMGGFGAPVLAREIQPDIVFCLDATYEAEDQDVKIGNGPVLTISDASVLLSCPQRDKLKTFFTRMGYPLQTEVYNYSGTDSRAFPHMGLIAEVYPLLIPTRGNHTPTETASMNDVKSLIESLICILKGPGELC